MAGDIRIGVDGLAQLRRDLRRLQPEALKEVRGALKDGAEVVARASGPLAHHRTGTLAAGYRAGTGGNTAFVRNRVPYAAVHEFGGTIAPKGTPITIRANPAIHRAFDAKADRVIDIVGDGIEAVARRNGWR